MILYIATANNLNTIGHLIEEWVPDLAGLIRTLRYDQLVEVESLPDATYLFADLARLSDPAREIVKSFADRVALAGHRIVNEPRVAKGRYELLRGLFESGRNPFNAYRLSEFPREVRFPVFVRLGRDHSTSESPLLENRADLDEYLVLALLHGLDPNDLLVIEFEDVADERREVSKFGAFRVGGQVLPRHLLRGSHWAQRVALRSPSFRLIEDERAYCESNPHQQEILDIFNFAGLEYGRIDYSIKGGKVVTWEINDNPMPMSARSVYTPEHLPHQERFAEALAAALRSLDEGSA
ncbi:MAG: hypothetical protein BroJett009_18550 [Armatimonadota bacterium]|nr:MAG: hypothetical protein BroJett009_18550 [Armatimonadota bacterium]